MLPAQFRHRSWLPGWVPMLLLLLCCGVAALAAATGPSLYKEFFPSATPSATVPFTPTPTATLTPTPTSTPTSTPDITATWLPLDEDDDGLTNAEELRLACLLSNSADTDGDGLLDGEEVEKYGTDPCDKDTDKDTWLDGDEVRMSEERFGKGARLCPQPDNADSDADGLKDSIDPDPCDLPTPTPSVTPTTTPVPSFALGAQINTNDHLKEARGAGMTWIKKQVRFGPGASGGAMAEELNIWKGQGFKVLLSVVGHREDMASGSAYYDQYAKYVGELAALGVDGIEIWNEQNIDREWPAGQINPSSYVDLLARASSAIRENGAGTMVISGAPAPTGVDDGVNVWADKRFVEGMAKAGAARFIDCVGIHYNEGIIAPSETSGDPRNPSDHYTRYFWGMVDTYWSAFDGELPLCFTELGYVSPEGYGVLPQAFWWAQDTSVSEQAAWLAEAAQLSYSSGKVELLIVWNLDFTLYSDQDPQAGYAIIRKDGSCPACEKLSAVVP